MKRARRLFRRPALNRQIRQACRLFIETLEDRRVLASDYSIAAAPPAVNEGNVGTTPLVYTITRTDLAAAGSIDFSIAGTATANVDFNNVRVNGIASPPSGTIAFAAGEAVAVVTVDVVSDTTVELDETISIALSNPDAGAGTISGTNPAVATLTNDDFNFSLDAGLNLVFSDSDIPGRADNLKISFDTGISSFVFTDLDNLLAASAITVPGAVTVDAHTVRIPLASIGGPSILVNTGMGGDVLSTDLATGNLPKAIVFDGGADSDELKLQGGGLFATVEHTTASVGGGSVTITGNGLVSYSGIDILTDNLSATARVFAFNAGSEVITMSDAAVAGAMMIDSTLSAPITFTNPSASLTIDVGVGALGALDTITVTSVDAAYRASTTITAGIDDTVNLDAALTLGSATSTGDLSITAGPINVNAGVDTSAASSGNVTLSGGLLTIAGDILATGKTVDINAAGVTETGGAITADKLRLRGTGTFTLGANNEVATLAAAVTGALTYNDASALTVGTVTTVGINTSGNDVTLTTGGLLTIANNITAAGSTVDINAAGVSETGGAISSDQLRLQGTGNFILLGNNAVGTIAANVGGSLSYNDVDALTIGSVLGTAGITSTGSVTVTASGALNVQENVTASADVELNAAVTIVNSPNTSNLVIAAGDTVASTGGDVNVTAEDNIAILGGISATAAGKVIRLTSSDVVDAPLAGAGGVTGSVITVQGSLQTFGAAGQIIVTGAAENDLFPILLARVLGQLVVRGGANDATLDAGVIRDTAAADVPPVTKFSKAPYFLPKVRSFVTGDRLILDDTGLTPGDNLNTDYVLDGERITRVGQATPFVTYPDHDLELLKLTTGRGNNDVTVNLATGGALPEIVQIDTQGIQGGPPDNRVQIVGTAGGDIVSIGDINLHPSLAFGPLGPIRAHLELNGFQRSWVQTLAGDDVIDNISSVPGLLDGGAGKDVINSIVNHPSSFPLNRQIQNSNPKNVTLVLGNEDADKLFVGSGALGKGVPATPLVNALRAFPDKSITFLVGDHSVVANKLTAVDAAKRKGDNYASSATAFQHGFIALGDFTDPAPAPNTSLGTFKFGAGDKVKFSTTIAWLKAQLFVGAAVPKLLIALNKQVVQYTKPVTDAAGEALADLPDGEASGMPVLDARTDVNRDGFLSPADALVIINEINAGGSRRVPGADVVEGEDASLEDVELTPTLDVNGDEYLSPADALTVINVLNSLDVRYDDSAQASDEFVEEFLTDEEPATSPTATTTSSSTTSATDALFALLASDAAAAQRRRQEAALI